MFDASDSLRSPLLNLLRSLSATHDRLVVVHDPLMSFAGLDAVTLPNAMVYRYHCVSAFFLLSFFHAEDLSKLPEEVMSESIRLILKPLDGLLTEEFHSFVLRRWVENPLECGIIINSCRQIENEFIELLAKQPAQQNKKLFIIGPTNPVTPENEAPARHECLEWLDKQPVASIVYVSFGTMTTISDEQIKQLAVGLQRSGQRFLWVLRDADLADIFANDKESLQRKLPDNFEEETSGLGLVLRGWAPQLDILAHPSTGAFMSHCGWNSCMEGLSMGVPIITFPMHSDQPRNEILVTDYLRAGAKVREWDRHEEVASAAEIEEAIKRVMVLDEGKGMRKRAQAVGEAVRLAVTDGGCSRADLDSFIEHIYRL